MELASGDRRSSRRMRCLDSPIFRRATERYAARGYYPVSSRDGVGWNESLCCRSCRSRILVFTPADAALPDNAVVNSATPAARSRLRLVRSSRSKGRDFSYRSDSVQQNPVRSFPSSWRVSKFCSTVAIPLLSVSPDEVQCQMPYGLENISSAQSICANGARGWLHFDYERGSGCGCAGRSRVCSHSPGPEPRAGILLHRAR